MAGRRAGVHTARAIGARRGRASWPAGRAPASRSALVYGLLGALSAAIASHGGVHISVVRATLTLFVFGAGAGLLGALAEARLLARLVVAMPRAPAGRRPDRDRRRAAHPRRGAALAGMAVAIHGGDASQILHDYRTGVTGQIGLTLVCALFGPNLAIWAASYLVGPGFVLGTGTAVSAAEVKLGAVARVAGAGRAAVGIRSPAGFTLLLGVPVAAALVAGGCSPGGRCATRPRRRSTRATDGPGCSRRRRSPGRWPGPCSGWRGSRRAARSATAASRRDRPHSGMVGPDRHHGGGDRGGVGRRRRPRFS